MARRGLDGAAVVAAAAAIADADGLEAATVARVAAELGVRGPSLYNHVAGRAGLQRGIAVHALRELTTIIRDAAVGRSGTAGLLAAAQAYRAYAVAHPGGYAALQRAPDEHDEERKAVAAELVAVLSGLLRAWALTGEDAIHAVRGLRSMLHGFVALERLGGFALDVPLEESYERMVRGFAAGLGGTSTA